MNITMHNSTNEGNNKMKTTNKISLIPLIAIFAALLGLVGCKKNTYTAWIEVPCELSPQDSVYSELSFMEDGSYTYTVNANYRAQLDNANEDLVWVEVCNYNEPWSEEPCVFTETRNTYANCGSTLETVHCTTSQDGFEVCTTLNSIDLVPIASMVFIEPN